ncbi:YqgE/AlgH family protein [Shewanella surugensis]|uniref:UPF0301 protein L2764_19175 n=1 Tax=Shewanella surugensis TaxID=212020 RepID=A0ABT0LG49_9GAMM|nr:YqgE/AlgH family protein [Shewanella surugensis]MCL1126549.1 YqgE/AlgH family protein [Shewanella surugensis]
MDSLQNHFLVSMPSLKDTYFERSVIYLCEHNTKGAMGIMINRPSPILLDELLLQINVKDSTEKQHNAETKILLGGPVTPERGFILHTTQEGWKQSKVLTSELMLTTSQDILASLGSPKAPTEFIVALGASVWDRGQLEQELSDNSWLSIPAQHTLLFDVDYDTRWQHATQPLGFDAWQLSNQMGHA